MSGGPVDWLRRCLAGPILSGFRGNSLLPPAAVMVAGGVCGLYALWIFLLPQPATLISVTATTGRVAIVTGSPLTAAVPIAGLRPATSAAEAASCLTGVLRPDRGAVIAYERGPDTRLVIALERDSATFEPTLGGTGIRFEAPFELVADPQLCDPAADRTTMRMPIFGTLRLGDDFRPTRSFADANGGLLIEGRLRIQARAIVSPLVPFSQPTVYDATAIDIPAGARVETSATRPELSNWWGIAYVDPQKPGLQVAATTEADRLSILHPLRTTPEVFQVTAFTQIFADPNIVRVQIIIAGLLTILGSLANIVGLFAKRALPVAPAAPRQEHPG